MDNKLTREQVLHVSHLARIGLEEEEISKYQDNLGQMIREIDKIKELNDFDEEIMFSPTVHNTPLVNSETSVCHEELLKNVPNKQGNFVKVPVIINE